MPVTQTVCLVLFQVLDFLTDQQKQINSESIVVVAANPNRKGIEVGRERSSNLILRAEPSKDVTIPQSPGIVLNFNMAVCQFLTPVKD